MVKLTMRSNKWTLAGLLFACGVEPVAGHTKTISVDEGRHAIHLRMDARPPVTEVTGTEVALADFTINPNYGVDAKAYAIQLPPYMKVKGDIRIYCKYLYVPDGGAVIDNSGDDAETVWKPAIMRSSPGQSGVNGLTGKKGESAGRVIIYADTVKGGDLTILSRGGRGADGQNASSGVYGVAGDNLDEAEAASKACCKKDGVTKGLAGGAGGRGGNGGNGGSGGNGGTVELYTTSLEGKFHVSNQGGSPGKAGQAGQGAPGGLGGHGYPTKCVKFGGFLGLGSQRRCFLPLGEDGDKGADGANGREGVDGHAGSDGPSTSILLNSSKDLRGHHFRSTGRRCDVNQQQWDSLHGDNLYRRGNFLAALEVYLWTLDLMEYCGESPVMASFLTEASLHRQNIVQNLDYFGRQQNEVPMLAFETLASHANEMLRVLMSIEGLRESLKGDFMWYSGQNQWASQYTETLNGRIATEEGNMLGALDAIPGLRNQIEDLSNQINETQVRLSDMGGACEDGIAKKVRLDTYSWKPTLKRIVKFFGKATMMTVGRMAHFSTTMYTALNIWNTLKAQMTDMKGKHGSLQAFENDAQPFIEVKNEVQQMNLMDYIKATHECIQSGDMYSQNCKVGQIKALAEAQFATYRDSARFVYDGVNDAVSAVGDIALSEKEQFEAMAKSLEAEFKRGETDADNRIKVLANGELGAFVDAWMSDIAACGEVRDVLLSLNALVRKRENLYVDHDTKVTKYVTATNKIAVQKRWQDSFHNFLAGFHDQSALDVYTSVNNQAKDLKNELIAILTQMQAALNFEFCEEKSFDFQDGETYQLEAFMSEMSAERSLILQRGRVVFANNPMNAAAGIGEQATATTIVELTRSNNEQEFKDFDSSGTIRFELKASNSALPVGVANMKVESAQGVVRGLTGEQGISQVWVKREGDSQCLSVDGISRDFKHPPRTYYSMYDANFAEKHLSPSMLTTVLRNHDEVVPSPVGSWAISLPQLAANDRSQVNKVELHLILSAVPCDEPTCNGYLGRSLSAAQNLAAAAPARHVESGTTNFLRNLALPVSCALVVLFAFALRAFGGRRSSQRSGEDTELSSRAPRV